jgi:hypothetical protein
MLSFSEAVEVETNGSKCRRPFAKPGMCRGMEGTLNYAVGIASANGKSTTGKESASLQVS